MSDLYEKLKAEGMLTIDEMLAGNLMGKFSTHTGVVDFESLKEWVNKQHETYLRMRLEYVVGNKEKDELYEWVFAHSAVFGTVKDHINKITIKPPTNNGE